MIGQTVDGRYQVEALLGRGGMGAVYRATDLIERRSVALKILHFFLDTETDVALSRFHREFRVLARLNHPHIMQAYDYGTHNDVPYLTLEFLEGHTLMEEVAAGPLSQDRLLLIAGQICEALVYLHAQTIVHRDLKPGNLMLLTADETPQVKLMDFGLIRLANPSVQLTQEGVAFGTVAYMAPEQAQGLPVDFRADLYALGIILYEMATGKTPFVHENPAMMLMQQLTTPPPSPRQTNPDLDEALEQLILDLLRKEPARRPATTELVATRLAELANEAAPTFGPPSPIGRVDLIPRIPLIGREAVLNELAQRWTEVQAGQGQVVLLFGTAGVGKTRLLTEAGLPVRLGNDRFFSGHCREHVSLPYQPLIEMLDMLLSDLPPSVREGLPVELARLLPSTGTDLTDDKDTTDQTEARLRLFAGCWEVLQQAAQASALMIAIEDVQWAEPTMLELLEYLARHVEQARVLLILSYRPEEIMPDTPLAALQRDLQRNQVANTITVDPLTHDQVADFLQVALGQAHIPTWLVDNFHLTTGGNPLFIEETLKALAAEGQIAEWVGQDARQWTTSPGPTLQLPQNVLALAERRLQQLATEDRSILTAAAVVGPEFSFALLQGVTKLDEDTLLDAVERLLAAHLIEELPLQGGEDRYRFAQEALRQALLKTISQRRLRTLHRRTGETIEAIYETSQPDHWPALAYHFSQAGVGEKAATYLLQAGDRARGLYAHQEAIEFYQRALAFLKEQKAYERAARTLMKLGLTYHSAFDFGQARQAYEEGFALWQLASEIEPAVPPPPAPHALRLAGRDPRTLDPIMADDIRSTILIDQLFSGLVEQRPQMEVVPEIAQSWEVLEGGRKYIFQLRDDVCWSDGTPVTAEDFEYAWKRALDPNTGSFNASLLYDIKGARAFHQGEVSDPDRVGVQALDEVTLEVELEGPTSFFLQLLAYSTTYPLPRHAVEVHGEAWVEVENIVTNGPFRLEAWQQGQSIVLEHNPEYRGRFTGNVQRVELRLSSTAPSAALELYEADRRDVLHLWPLPGTEMERIRQRHADDYRSEPHLSTEYTGFNVSRPPFDDPRVRRAFVLAIDREKLADVVLGGYRFPALGGFIPPAMPGHSVGLGLPYDPDQARKLLTEAGFPKGRDFPSVEWLISPGDEPEVEYLQAQWHENLGIEIVWQAFDWDMLLSRLDHEPPDLFQTAWIADYPDPDNFLRTSFVQLQAGWWDETYERLVEEARRVTDQAERMKLYQQADRILIGEAVIMPLLYGRVHFLVKPWLSRYPTSPIKDWFWKDVIIEPH